MCRLKRAKIQPETPRRSSQGDGGFGRTRPSSRKTRTRLATVELFNRPAWTPPSTRMFSPRYERGVLEIETASTHQKLHLSDPGGETSPTRMISLACIGVLTTAGDTVLNRSCTLRIPAPTPYSAAGQVAISTARPTVGRGAARYPRKPPRCSPHAQNFGFSSAESLLLM